MKATFARKLFLLLVFAGILDLQGAVVREYDAAGTEARLNLSSLPEGIFTLYITGDQGSYRTLILKL